MPTTLQPPQQKTNPVALKVNRVKVPHVNGDTSTQRHLDNTSDAVDGTLSYINSVFQLAPSTTAPLPSTKTTPAAAATNTPKPLVTRAGLTTQGAITAQGAVNAASIAASGTVNAAAIASSGPVTATTINGTSITGTAISGTSVTSIGPVTGTTCSFPSSSFRMVVGPFCYTSTSYPGGIQACGEYGGVIELPSSQFGYIVPFSGSLVAVSGVVQCSKANTSQPYYYTSSAGNVVVANVNVAAASTNYNYSITYPKGSIVLSPGMVLGAAYGGSAASMVVYITVYLTIELAP